MAGNVLVFAERREGETKRSSLEAVSVARRLADTLGGKVCVLALGPGAESVATDVAPYGADELLTVDDARLELYAAQAYAACLAAAATRAEAVVVLLAASVMGKELSARTAARLATACASDLIEVDVNADGVLKGLRPVYSGKALARIAVPEARPVVASLRPNVFALAEADTGRKASAAALDVSLDDELFQVTTTELRKAAQQEKDVAEASIVVSGGRGLKEAENFGLVRDLAAALDGAVGASRAVVDAGWIGHASQVGQTGKVVSPTLYIACGISGAIQHLAGMSSSKVIVAINKDPEAPIFKVADYGIVGDLFEVIPAMTAAVRKLNG
jgi:electron transfer flavoprotein alpha subunit